MSERFTPEQQPASEPADEEQPKKIGRRAFIAGAAATAGAAAVYGPEMLSSAKEWQREREDRAFRENVEAEKEDVVQDVSQGLVDQQRFELIREKHNDLIDKMRKHDKDSDEYIQFDQETDSLRREIEPYYWRKGTLRYGPLEEANPYAHTLREDTNAVLKLATLRVLFRDASRGPYRDAKKLKYQHNAAKAYLELGGRTQGNVKETFRALEEYARQKHINVSSISQEIILYAFIHESFDFSLSSTQVKQKLDAVRSDWQQWPATHANRDSYSHYNKLKAFHVFDLNRCMDVLEQLSRPAFVENVFATRDADLANRRTEYGGVVERSSRGEELRVLAADDQQSNNAYRIPSRQRIESLLAPATFHFHATALEEPTDTHGPSGLDQAFFAPGVVFTSLDETTILVHFYSSRISQGEFKIDVLSLGTIKKPGL